MVLIGLLIRVVMCLFVVVFVDDTLIKVGALTSAIPLYISIKMCFNSDTIFITAIVKAIVALKLTDYYGDFIIFVFTLMLTITTIASIQSFLIGYILVGILLVANSFTIFILTKGLAQVS